MKKKTILLVGLIVIISGFYILNQLVFKPKSILDYKVLSLDEANAEILKTGEEELTYLFNNRKSSSIEASDWEVLDSLILEGVKAYNIYQLSSPILDRNIINLNDYKCYYVPMLNSKNQKLIYVLAVNTRSNKWWEFHEILKDREGDNPVFSITVNITTNKELGIISNGKS